MRLSVKLTALVIVAVLAFGFSGCKKGDGQSGAGGGTMIDISKPISEIKAMVDSMDVEQITKAAVKYKEAIEAKQPELVKLKDALSALPVTEMLGDEAKKLKTDIEEVTKSISELKERFNIYYNKLIQLQADVSELRLEV